LQRDDKNRIEKELKRAASFLFKEELYAIMPEDGFELVYALTRAVSAEMVGRIIVHISPVQNEMGQNPEVTFGETSQISSGILTAMRFCPEIRSSCSLQYSEKLTKICEKMLLYVCKFDAFQIPPGVSTMDWTVAFCSGQEEGVPDIISVKSNDPGRSSLRIFGESPFIVTTNIIKIAERISDETL